MKVLIDINHPAHVHFFKHLYWKLKNEGHEVTVVASKKEINFELLENYNIPFINIGTYGKTLISKLLKLIWLDLKMLLIVFKEHPDYILGINTIRGAHAGFLFPKTKVFVFNDTEHAKEQIALYKPFADKVFTPDCYLLDLGKKQVRYAGYHELAYTHPKYFKPNPKVLETLGLSREDTFFILRFISWGATHDSGHKGISDEGKRKLIEILQKKGEVFITSEGNLPPDLEKYKLETKPEDIHTLLYYAALYIGESGTMATEAALLGTPNVRVSTIAKLLGNTNELSKAGILLSYDNEQEALEKIKELLNQENLKKDWRKRTEEFLKNKIDVTQFILDNLTKERK